MEPPTPFSIKTLSKEINNKKIDLKLFSSENVLSLSTELDNKKYRLTSSLEELQKNHSFFKQFSSFEQILNAISKIITSTNNIKSKQKNIFELIYKATRDGDDVKDFHKFCDEISPTLTLCKTKNGNRFGGYTSVSLTKNASDNPIYDPNAFVFTIDKKYKYNTNNPSYAVRMTSSRGPCFGSNCPFYIGNKFLKQNTSYSNPSNDYNSPPYVLTGAEYFTLDELEVYKVNIQ